MIRLVKVDHHNVWDLIRLNPTKEQEYFIAPNDESLMEAYIAVTSKDSYAYPFGIYDYDTPVGFLMIGYNEAGIEDDAPEALANNYSIWRFMIDQRYQGKGYGRKAMQLALDFIRTWPSGKAEYCALSYEPENEVARKLYASCGFIENGEMDEEEIVAILKL